MSIKTGELERTVNNTKTQKLSMGSLSQMVSLLPPRILCQMPTVMPLNTAVIMVSCCPGCPRGARALSGAETRRAARPWGPGRRRAAAAARGPSHWHWHAESVTVPGSESCSVIGAARARLSVRARARAGPRFLLVRACQCARACIHVPVH